MKQTLLTVAGMSCAGCVASVERALRQVPGVQTVLVDLPGGRATVGHGDAVSPADLAAAVNGAGYDAEIPAS